MKRLALALLALAAPGAASAQQGAPSADAPKDAATPAQSTTHAAMGHQPAPACAEAKVDCAATAVPAFARDGRLWVAFSVGKTVYAAASSDNGKTFSAPTAIATVADGMIDAHGDARPKIAPLNDG
ncbi:MAG TPA: sialidase family protein, partial [Methylocystis sp.]